MQPHISILLLWIIYSYIEALHNHMGYEVPYFFFLWSPASRHDFHHELPVNGMYGKYRLLDYLLGTDKRYRTSMAERQAAEEQAKKKMIDFKQE